MNQRAGPSVKWIRYAGNKSERLSDEAAKVAATSPMSSLTGVPGAPNYTKKTLGVIIEAVKITRGGLI